VTRHEIDYHGNVTLGEHVTGKTWIERPPKGATFDRRVDFTDAAGKVIVSANTSWAMLGRATMRLMRVPRQVVAPFLPTA
jgi:acyl-CoA thioester hydrolase